MKPSGKTTLIVVILGLAWIWGSDYIVYLNSAKESFNLVDPIKGSGFVIVFSIVVYILVERYHRAISRSESTYEALFRNHPDPMFLCDPSSLSIIELNQAARDFYGFTRSDLIGKSLSFLRKTDGNDHPRGQETHVIRSGKNVIVEIGTRQTSHLGKEALLVAIHDITEREELKKALLQRERMLDSLVMSELSMLVRIDQEGRFIFTNQAFRQAHFGKDGEFIGRPFSDIIHPDDRKLFVEVSKKAVSNPGNMFPADLRKADGIKGWVYTTWEILATLDEDGNVNGIQAVGHDSSEVTRIRHESKKRDAQLEVLLDSITDGFFILDSNLNIELCNRVFAELVSRDTPDCIGKPISELLPNFHNTRSSIELPQAIRENRSVGFEAYNPFFDTWFMVNAYPFDGGLAVFYRNISEEKKKELETTISEANLKSVINTTRDFIWSIDTEYRLVTANRPVLQQLEAFSGKVAAKGTSAIPEPAGSGLSALIKPLYDQALSGAHVSEELDLRPIESFNSLIDIRISPIRDDQNTILGAACFARDITEQELQRQALVKAVERYETLTEVTMDAIWDMNLSESRITWSIGMKSTFGHDILESGLDWWAERIHPDDREEAERSLNESIAGKEGIWACEYRFINSEGNYHWVLDRGMVIRDASGNPIRMLGSMQDITVLKESLSEVQKLSLVAERTSNGVVITDARGRIEWCNEAYEKMTGYSMKEVIGKKPGDVLQGPESSEETIARISEAIRKREDITEELVNYGKAGNKYWVKLTISPVIMNGTVERFIAIETDITREKQVAGRLQIQNKKLREIAFILSHNLRKPVSSILGLVELYDTDHPDNKMNQDIIKYLHSATSELDEMIHEIIKQSALIDD